MSSSINILQISVRADIGGGPEHLYRLVKGLDTNYKCVIAAPKDIPYFELFREMVGEKNTIEIPHRKFNITVLLELKSVIKRRGISIIHSHGKGAGIYSRLLGLFTKKKVIHTLHGFHVGNYNSLQKNLYIWLEKFLALFTYKFIAVSRGEKNEIVNAGICPAEKIVVIPNGVEIPIQSVSDNNFTQKPRKFISFSRFNFQKNTELIINLCELLKQKNELEDIEFHIYGDGEEFGEIKNLIEIKELKSSIILHGADPNSRDKLVSGFCYISSSRWEGLPISLLEAIAVGLPVLATDVVGNNDIINDEKNGLLFSLSNLEDAAQKVSLLTKDFTLWKKLSHNAKDSILKEYSINKMILETEKVYLS